MENTFQANPPVGGTNVINVGKLERMASIGMGMGLLCSALRSKGFFKYAAILGAGGYLLYRGASGNCPLSSSMGIRGGQGTNLHGKRAALIEINSFLTVNRPREAVYTFWRKLENLPRFMTHLEKVEATDERHSRWTAKFPGAPGSISWDAEIIRDEEGSLIAWRSLPGSTIENAGEVTFTDAPGERGTEVEVRISYRPPAGNLGEGVARLLNPVLEDLIREDIRNFKQYLESGEIPAIKDQASAGQTPGS
ncbi:SRPBCC family protein [Anseongella ginsenosidimutans]|nr:SRPBCC family protein [Anseongella ginsenosidimutans]